MSKRKKKPRFRPLISRAWPTEQQIMAGRMQAGDEHQLTPKQESFCFAYIETGNASEAYRRSYDASNMKPETVNRKAAELLDNGKITARLTLFQTILRQRHEITVDSLVQELEQARALAMKTETPSAAVAATLGKAKICGLIVDKNEHAGKDGAPLVSEHVSTRDLARAIMDILRTATMEPEPEPEATRALSAST